MTTAPAGRDDVLPVQQFDGPLQVARQDKGPVTPRVTPGSLAAPAGATRAAATPDEAYAFTPRQAAGRPNAAYGSPIRATEFIDENGSASSGAPNPQSNSAKPAAAANPGTAAPKNDAAVPKQTPPDEAKLLRADVTSRTDAQGNALKLTDRAKALAGILQRGLTPGVLATLTRSELFGLLEVSTALQPQAAAAFAEVFAAAICEMQNQLGIDLVAAFIGGIDLDPRQQATNLASLVKTPGFLGLLTDGLIQLGNANQLGNLVPALKWLLSTDVRAVVNALDLIIYKMGISAVTLDIASAVLGGLRTYLQGPHEQDYEQDIKAAMDRINEHIHMRAVTDVIDLARTTDPKHPAALAAAIGKFFPRQIIALQWALERLGPQDAPVFTALAAAVCQTNSKQLKDAVSGGIRKVLEKATGADRSILDAALQRVMQHDPARAEF